MKKIIKHKITLLSFIFFMTLFSFGQRKGIKDNRYDEKSRVESQIKKMNRGENEYREGHLFIKSRVFFQNSRVNFSQSISSPLVIKYGLDYEISQFWDETLSQWVNGWKPEYIYDTNGNLTQQNGYGWYESQWVHYSKIEYTYDTNRNLTQYIEYSWNGSEFVNDLKTEYTYDTNGTLTQEIYYSWNVSQWSSDSKTEYITYDTNGNLTQYIEYYWDISQWVINLKTEYTYDTNGNITQYIEYYWDISQWVINLKTDYTYDTNGNLTQYIEYYWDGVQWYSYSKTDYTYDTNGNLTQYIDVYWNGVQWGNDWKTEFTYNNSYSFSDLILPFFYSNTEVKMFFNHMLTNGKGYIWDETLSDWKINDNFDFFYSEKDILSISEIIEEQLKIYPNPVSNILTIKSEIILIDKVEIYSVLGKKIKEINLDFNNINTEDLSKGLYLIWIYSEKGTTVKKLIKK
jgi:hypothetical protein